MKILKMEESEEAVYRLLNRRPETQKGMDISLRVAEIIREVQLDGDTALIKLTAQFDGVILQSKKLRVDEAEIDIALQSVPEDFLAAIRLAKANIIAFHTKQLPKDWLDVKDNGVILGQRYQAVEAAGLYVPGGVGGTTPLVSSVLMNALPAVVAGVKRMIICTPPNKDGGVNPYLLAAAHECGIGEIYKVGGAQAIAAMAYGTKQIVPVDMIVGPGNRYVTEAKRQVYGYVGLDMLAGPSELLIIADGANNPEYIAADLLSQAEHGPVDEAGSFLLTPDPELATAVAAAVERRLSGLSRAVIARASLTKSGGIVITRTLDEAFKLANYAAPEHLELLVADPWNQIHRLKHAGAIFIGPYATEPIGDYVAGTNHVLPTNGTSRFASGLNVDHFIKKTSIISYNQAGLAANGPAAIRIAQVEGLDAHAGAIKVRLDDIK
jgi:histidinol dehydrogenase